KMHVAFAVLRQGPVDVTVTAGNGSERAEWRRLVQPGGFYVVDRGYVDYGLFQELHELPCSFLCRVKDNAAYEGQEGRARTPAAMHAGVVRDAVLRRLGTAHHTRLLPQPFRLVQVATGKTRKDGTPDVVVLVTNRLDLDAELIAVAYRYRWAVELFFRWVKCVLGCRHLLSQGINGVRLQVYAAFIASLLISLWVGRTPTKRTYEMLCFYLSGWAMEAELIAHIDRLYLKAPPLCKNCAGHYWDRAPGGSARSTAPPQPRRLHPLWPGSPLRTGQGLHEGHHDLDIIYCPAATGAKMRLAVAYVERQLP